MYVVYIQSSRKFIKNEIIKQYKTNIKLYTVCYKNYT